jgi:hypothetical protein
MTISRLAAVLAVGLLQAGPVLAQTTTAPATPNAITAPARKTIGVPVARTQSEAMIVLNARRAKLASSTLTLDGVAPVATLFASRPVRSAGHMQVASLVDLWSTGSFAKDPPNATVSAFARDGSRVTDAVVTLRTPKIAGDKLSFDVAVLEGSLDDADGPASVFIDTIWFGIGDSGFSYLGQSQTTGGTDPAIGSAHDTSTFSGWSNPAPDYRPPYRAPSVGAPPPPDYRAAPLPSTPVCGAPPLLPCY